MHFTVTLADCRERLRIHMRGRRIFCGCSSLRRRMVYTKKAQSYVIFYVFLYSLYVVTRYRVTALALNKTADLRKMKAESPLF